MCRSCADGGRRCPSDAPERRRARQNAAYHAKKHTTTPRTPESGDDDPTQSTGLAPLEGPVTPEQVRERVEHAQSVLARAEDTPLPDRGEGAYRPGQRLTNTNENGWQVPTEYGLEAEAATRAAGEAIAARAEVILGDDLEHIGQDKAVQSFMPGGAQSRDEYATFVTNEAEKRKSDIAKLRKQAKSQTDTELHVALQIEANSRVEEANRFLKEAALAQQGDSAWDRVESRAYSNAYRQALAEQRDMGLRDGRMIATDTKSQKATVERLKKGLAYYPSDWLDREGSYEASWETNGVLGPQQHQAQIPLRVRTTSKRAHYSHVTSEMRRSGGNIQQSIYSELTIDKHDAGCLGPGVSTAVHEYGHRAERIQPRVNDLAQTHLARRTMHDNGERHEMEPYLVGKSRLASGPSISMDEYERRDLGKSEWVRSDDFADRYTGKQNSHREDSSEVFTTGMEGVFSGRFGGLRGAGNWKEDREHRDFILGTLATVK